MNFGGFFCYFHNLMTVHSFLLQFTGSRNRYRDYFVKDVSNSTITPLNTHLLFI
jgi:hypothetical protein